MVAKVIIDGFDTSSIPGCVLTDFDGGDVLSLNITENKLFAMNGTKRSIDSFGDQKRTVSFFLDSFEKTQQLINAFDGLNKTIEFWHIPNSFYFYDCIGANVKATTLSNWKVDIKIAIHPFRYQKNVQEIILGKNGSVNNVGNVFSEPRITVEGFGASTLAIGGQIMKLNLSSKATIECKHGEQCVYDEAGIIKNSIRMGGGFFEIQPGTQGVVSSGGITKITILPRWRWKV